MARIAAKSKDLTEGSLFKNIILFSVPLILTNLLQMLYNAADMMTVGFSHEPNAVGAIGITSPFLNLVINIFMGFSTGTTIVLARYLGAKNEKAASRTVHTSLLVGLIFGFVSMVVGLIISRPVLSAMGAEGKLLDLATLYTQIYFLCVPFLALSNYLISIFRAKGDTKTPMIVLAFSGLLNVLLNFFFVFVLHTSVEGVAIATAIANAVSFFVLLFFLSREDGACRFCFRDLRIDRTVMTDIIRVGLPSAIQGSLFSLSNIIIQSSILRVNNIVSPPGAAFEPVVKGNAAMTNLEAFVYTALQAVSIAALTFTSQHLGAKKFQEIRRVTLICCLVGVVISLAGSLSVYAGHSFLISLYGVVDGPVGSLEHIAYETAVTRIYYALLPYFLLALMDIGSSVVRGLGKATSSAIISLIGACLFRILWLYTVFPANPTLEIIYISFSISWFITAVAQLLYANLHLRRIIREDRAAIIKET